MRSLADGLPPDVLADIPKEWFDNEREYWKVQPEILADFNGQWIAFADGLVIASGPIPVDVYHAAAASKRHPYMARVGAEYEPTRMRRVTFAGSASVWFSFPFSDYRRDSQIGPRAIPDNDESQEDEHRGCCRFFYQHHESSALLFFSASFRSIKSTSSS
jgi:hypothetical protein